MAERRRRLLPGRGAGQLGTLEQALAEHTIIGVDTMPFIYLWERHPRYLPLSEALFRYRKEPDVQGITSLITLIETCVLPQRQGAAPRHL